MASGVRLLLPTTPAALAGAAAAVCNALLRVAIVPLFVAPLMDSVMLAGELDRLGSLLGLAALLVIGGSLALWAQDALLARAAAQIAARARERIYRRLLGRAPGELGGSSGGLASRVIFDLREVENYYQFGLGTLVAESVAILAILAVLLASNALATGLLLLLFIPLLLALRLVGRYLERIAQRSQEGMEEVGTHLQEGLKHHEVIRSFGATEFLLDRFRKGNERTERAMTRRGLVAAAQIPVTQILAFAAVGVLVAVLAISANEGNMTIGEIVSFITLVALLSTPAQLLPRGLAMYQQAAAAARRLGQLDREAPQPVGDTPGAGRPGHAGEQRVELRDLTVSLGGTKVLHSLSAVWEGPGLVVIEGESGSGKTTLLRTLLRFIRPAAGEVRVGGLELSRWEEAQLRSHVAYVPQGHDLLAGSIRANLDLGRGLPDELLWQALASVGMEETVRAAAGGLQHELGEDGGGFSGGQRQRLGIARALLSDPAVLLLDEPTSNLDAAAEASIVQVLRDQARRRLVLAVAHRPALAQAAHEVYRMEDGRLRKIGEARQHA